MDGHLDGHEETIARPDEGLQDDRPQDWFEVMRSWWDQRERGGTDSAR